MLFDVSILYSTSNISLNFYFDLVETLPKEGFVNGGS